MKKSICLLLLLFVFKAEAQKSVLFKMKYLPNRTYTMGTSMTMNFNVDLSGNEDIIEKIKAEGFTQPIKANIAMSTSGNTKTGAPGADNVTPMIMAYKIEQISVKIGEKAIPVPLKANSQVSIYGHVGQDGKFKADSLNGNNLKDTSEKKITQIMNAIQNKIKFPEKPMHIGDTFTQEMPISIPMAENNGETNVKATYKLVSIANGNAYFDIIQNADVQINIKGVELKISGSGTGKLVYSIKNNFPLDYKTSLNLAIDGKINTLIIKGTAILDADYNNTIN
ncbi:MAG: hypothetical protein JWR09_5378 [Mucilaginibacter sp.]|nr:hypothetical protein [Mucilaginibacter sp.]